MANTTFGNLKINALRLAGNNYNSGDTTRLSLAGTIINDVLGVIQTLIKGHPFTLDIGNTVSTTASQAYVEPTDTDIIEILQVYQRSTNRKLPQITYTQYIELVPDPTRFGGLPDMAWAPTMSVDGTGNNDWRIYLLPTPSSVITLYYDYIKDLRLSADGSFSPLPPTYDRWIYEEFKPIFYEIIDSKNFNLIRSAKQAAAEARSFYLQAIMSQADRFYKVGSKRGETDYRRNLVASTPTPT